MPMTQTEAQCVAIIPFHTGWFDGEALQNTT